MKLSKTTLWFFFAIMVAGATTWFTLHQLLLFPGKVVHVLGGDGIKNYYTYIYHALYGSGWWFDGMNYPYGEHIMYVDGQPLLTVTLSWLRNYISFTPEDLNALLNILLVAGFFLAIIYVYKILRKFEVAPLWSAVFAAFIVPMCMQTFMMFGLYGLGYACVMPMTFYWFIGYKQHNSYTYIIYLFLLSVIVMFLHPYQFALILFWSCIYIVACLFRKGARQQKFRHLAPVVLLIISTVIIFKLTTFISDPVTDRPGYPHGLLAYGTTGNNIFKLRYSPYWQYLHKKGWAGNVPEYTIGYAYTGIVSIAVLIISILIAVYYLARKKKEHLNAQLPGAFSGIWLIIGLAALLYSMGVPFVWGLDFLYDYVSVLRQFRALNWFAIIFYYIATIYVVVRLYHFYRAQKSKGKLLPTALLIIPVLLWGFETYGVIKKVHVLGYGVNYGYDAFYSKLDQKSWPQLLDEDDRKAGDFQAMIYVPYYHVGSEKIWLASSAWGFSLSFSTAVQLQLPMVDASMSRSSWAQTFAQVKIAGGPYTYKKLFEEHPDRRPYLLMRLQGEVLNPDEKYLFETADSIGMTSGLIAYALYPDKLLAKERLLKEKMLNISKTLLHTDTSLLNKTPYYHHFDNINNTQSLWGSGSFPPVSHTDSLLDIIETSGWEKNTLYEASVWFHVNDYDYKSPDIALIQFDTSGTKLAENTMAANKATDTHDMWLRAYTYFTLDERCSNLTLTLKAKDTEYYGMDELLIRTADDTIVTKSIDGKIMVNNHILHTGD